MLVFAGVQVVAQRDPTTPPATLKLIDAVLVTVGFLYLGYFIVRVVGDLDGFFTRANAEDLLVPPALTLGLIPFLYLTAWWSQREQKHLQERFGARINSPA